MKDTIRTAAWRWIAGNRRSAAVRRVHKAAEFVERAWSNRDFDLETNGEGDLLRALSPAGFRTVLDVGANVGDWSTGVLKLWPQCRLHSF